MDLMAHPAGGGPVDRDPFLFLDVSVRGPWLLGSLGIALLLQFCLGGDAKQLLNDNLAFAKMRAASAT